MGNRIISLFNIKYPIIQAGMVWCAGWELASAVSNSGGLGIIGSGSMYPDILEQHIRKCKSATKNSFAVNIPLLYPNIEKHMDIVIRERVQYVFTSAGNPKIWTSILKSAGIKVTHVVPSVKFAIKAQDAGVDAIVAEGFEAGGHNGREETTSMVLIPLVREAVNAPLIAAGGIASGKAMLAAMVLGAEAVQIGSRFVTSHESSAHDNFKTKVAECQEGDTMLTMKDLTPVRLIKNRFFNEIVKLENHCASKDDLIKHLGIGRAKKGMFEGDLDNGELEIGQVSAQISNIKPASEILEEIWSEYKNARRILCTSKY